MDKTFEHPFGTLCKVTKSDVQKAIDEINSSKQEDIFLTLKPCMIILREQENDTNAFSNLDDPQFLNRLRDVDIEQLSPQVHKKLSTLVKKNQRFKPQKMAKVNPFCHHICDWVHKIVRYQEHKAIDYSIESPRQNGVSPRRYGASPNRSSVTNGTGIKTYQKADVSVPGVSISLIPDEKKEKKLPEDLDQLPFYMKDNI